MKTILASALLLATIGSTAHANPQARAALKAVPQSQIDQSLEKALKEMSPNAPLEANKVADYTSCLKDAAYVCSRYVLFTANLKEGNRTFATESVVIELNASLENGKVSIETAYDSRTGEVDLNSANIDVVLAALAKLEGDYKGEAPIRSKPADHPFQIKVMIIANNSESSGNGDDQRWDSRDNYLVQFSESGYSRVVGWVSSDTYLVRVKDVNEKRVKIDVKKLLKLDELLK